MEDWQLPERTANHFLRTELLPPNLKHLRLPSRCVNMGSWVTIALKGANYIAHHPDTILPLKCFFTSTCSLYICKLYIY